MPRNVSGNMLDVANVKGIGPKSLSLLNKIGIYTVDDLVTHYPFRYDILERSDLKKVTEEDKAKINTKVEALKAVKDGEDIEAIKKAMDELNQEFYAISSKLYADANPQGAEGFDPNNMGGANNAGAAHDDNVVDADFEVKEDK